MTRSFKDHEFSEAEITWLRAVYHDREFDPKKAKVKLRNVLPKGFDPKKIDQRFLIDGKRLTLLGIWRVDPESPALKQLEQVILTIKALILEGTGIETITSELLCAKLGLQGEEARRALGNLDYMSRFYSSASGRSGEVGYGEIRLTGDTAYDGYLAFESLELLLQEYYETHEPGDSISYSYTVPTQVVGLGTLTQGLSGEAYVYHQRPEILQYEVKRNAAFVLMPMDRENPELQDVYETIKQACRCFGVQAYRADEIEHQDKITDLILSEIERCEMVIADLSYERPNVYYEIGYAPALKRRPILFRKTGTRLHFDLLVHNAPEYRNLTELRSLLLKRLEAVLGRSPAPM